MSTNHLDRRDFSRLSLAALGGAIAGTTALAQQAPPINPPAPIAPPRTVTPPKTPATTPKTEPPKTADAAKPEDAKPADKSTDPKDAKKNAKKDEKKKPKEIHICRGLNTCAGKGASGDNKCAGQGTCATTPGAPHQCATGNLCRGQGGCGPTAGKNQCSGYGDGSVPILDEEWPRLRAEFENRMKRLKRPVGPAPASAQQTEDDDRLAIEEAKFAAEQARKEQEALEGKTPPGKSGDKNADKGKNQGKTQGRTQPPPKRGDAAANKETKPGETKPGTNRPARPPAKKEEETGDILGELTGEKDKKETPKPKK